MMFSFISSFLSCFPPILLSFFTVIFTPITNQINNGFVNIVQEKWRIVRFIQVGWACKCCLVVFSWVNLMWVLAIVIITVILFWLMMQIYQLHYYGSILAHTFRHYPLLLLRHYFCHIFHLFITVFILPGDIGSDLDKIRSVLTTLIQNYDAVCYVPGKWLCVLCWKFISCCFCFVCL